MMFVLSFIFKELLGRGIKTFPVHIYSGRLLYDLFSKTTKECTKSLRSNSTIMKKVRVKKYLYPLSSLGFNFVVFLLSLLMFIVVCIVMGVYPTKYVILSFVPLTILFFTSLGVGLILSIIGAYFKDTEYLWNKNYRINSQRPTKFFLHRHSVL